jgi:transposase
MAERHDLRDDEWDRIKHLLPSGGRPGRPWRDHRQVINGMLWILSTGAAWRDLPRRYGPWSTAPRSGRLAPPQKAEKRGRAGADGSRARLLAWRVRNEVPPADRWQWDPFERDDHCRAATRIPVPRIGHGGCEGSAPGWAVSPTPEETCRRQGLQQSTNSRLASRQACTSGHPHALR